MLQGLFVLLLFQLLGETVARGLGLPVPGPVIGVVLLVAALAIRARWRRGEAAKGGPLPVETAADGLLRHLGLLFVPAGVGVAQSYHALGGQLLAVGAALVGSTAITLVVTVAVFRLVSRGVERSAGR
ncbi:CidA/LrgA family protein [Hansschlegelia plantiphila]|uniref:CidA/LrgA family protein n=1 Tax=Hansschlegelia plantiphila TaxID=374655 RepID=A0A9W6J3U9_9HYPH|nr:CidA/LrgA family protein [Hansschlegelia plantiphila]GLK69847.1 CidA/LrgA family protein [Hansschlegelia plantiphila]